MSGFPISMAGPLLAALRRLDREVDGEKYYMNRPHCYELPLPLEIEEELTAALADEGALDLDAWKAVRAKVGPELDGKLMGYALRMSTLATRVKDEKYVRAAALASVLGGDVDYDWRDLLIVTSAVNDAAKRIGADGEAIIRAAARVATPHRSNTLLTGFLRRKDIAKEPDGFAIEAVQTPQGVLYNFPAPRA